MNIRNKVVFLLLIAQIINLLSISSFAQENQGVPEAQAVPVVENSNKIVWSGTLFYSLTDKLSFNSISATVDGGNYVGTANYGIQNSIGIAVDVYQSEVSSWGWSAGLAYDYKRDLKNYNATLGGVSDAGMYSSSIPSITFFNLYGNAIYRWNKVYLPVGLNLSLPTLSSANGYSVSGSFGSQLGLGVFVAKDISLELLLRNIAIKSEKSGVGYHIDLGTGYITGTNLQVKFSF